jgi:hypothetical protein
MKNQNDLIISISVGVVAVIVAIVIFATSPQPTKPADPAVVDTSAPQLPKGDVVMTNGTASVAGGAGGFGGQGGFGGGPGGMSSAKASFMRGRGGAK